MEGEKKKCAACRNLIWSDATLCPYCRSEQKKLTRKSFTETLKQLSGITVVFSLIFAVMELNRFVDTWLENTTYAERLARSSELIIDARDLTGAWDLLLEAKQVHPASKSVSRLQLQLAMIRIRESGLATTSNDAKKLIESLFALYRGLGTSDTNDADVLAHIAWASYLLRKKGYDNVDISGYLDKALTLDSNSTYANAIKGYWLLQLTDEMTTKTTLTDSAKVTRAQNYFEKALQTGIDSDFVRNKQLTALYSTDTKNSAAKFVRVALNMKIGGDNYLNNHSDAVLKKLKNLYYSASNQDADGKSDYIRTVFLALSEEENQFLLDWLDSSDESSIYSALHQARLNEELGSYKLAIEQYIKLYGKVKTTSYGLRFIVPKLINRICLKPEVANSQYKVMCDDFINHIVTPSHLKR